MQYKYFRRNGLATVVLVLLSAVPAINAANNRLTPSIVTSPVRFDFDGDRKADFSIFRPSEGNWYLSNSSGGYAVSHFGATGDIPVAADYDGDGKYDLAVYRSGVWYLLGSRDNAFRAIGFGLATDIPTPSDYDGDGRSDIAVFRASDGVWHLLLSSNQNYVAARFGTDGDIPLPADFDGDGKADLNVFRGSEGNWYRQNSSNNSLTVSRFGMTGDVPVRGDFDGDLKDDVAVWRPSTGVWYINRSSNSSLMAVAFGLPTDIPTPADFDGDGKTDIAVYRPTDGVWHRIESSTAQYQAFRFGAAGDIPAPGTTNPAPVVTPPSISCTWYVTTTGIRTNSGSQASPWNLAWAFSGAGGAIHPGDTVCLMGGTYPGRYVPTLNGTSTRPIVVRAYPGQRVVLDGGLPMTTITADTTTATAYGDSFISVASTNNIQVGATIRIGNENMQVSSINYSTGVVRVVRGWGGSCSTGTCGVWPSGSVVGSYYGILDVAGSYTWIWGMEITNSTQTNRIELAGQIDKGTGLTDSCTAGCKFINNVIHNNAAGIGSFNGNASGNEYYGNLMFLNGWDGSGIGTGDPGKGHGMYIQNLSPTAPPKKVIDNLSFMNFGFNMQAYSDNGGINNLEYTGNAFFESSNPILNGPTFNVLVGGGNQNFVGLKFTSNFTYNPTIAGVRRGTDIVGWGDTFCTSPMIQDNYLASGNFALSINCSTPTMTGNTAYTNFGRESLFPNNVYNHARPTTQKIFVRPNTYETGRGNIIVYNWPRAGSISVDISSLGLQIGQHYQIRDAENFNGPTLVSGTYNGSSGCNSNDKYCCLSRFWSSQ